MDFLSEFTAYLFLHLLVATLYGQIAQILESNPDLTGLRSYLIAPGFFIHLLTLAYTVLAATFNVSGFFNSILFLFGNMLMISAISFPAIFIGAVAGRLVVNEESSVARTSLVTISLLGLSYLTFTWPFL